MSFELRPYQAECVKRVVESYEQNPHGRELIVLPTAAGKTVVFSQVIKALHTAYGTAAMVIAHRDELLTQAADKYRMVKPDAIIGKVGSGVHEYGGEVTVAGIATISRPEHIKRLKAIFGTGSNLLMIVDEAHHVAAPGYQKVLEALPDAFVLMVTATSDRLDGKPIIDKPPIYQESILTMIPQGYLCDVRAIAIRTETNLDELHTEMGDYKVSELEDAVDTPKRNQRVVEAYREHAEGRRAICFGVTVAHATNLSVAFQSAGIAAAVVSGETPLDERQKLYKALRTGEIRVLTNVQVLTEGFDEPLVDCVIMARPTQSRSLYVQSIGRGLRLAPAKKDCLILDLTDNCLKHRLEPQSLRKVLGKDLKDDETLTEALEREEKEQAARETRVRKLKDARKEDIQINILEKLDWKLKENGMYVLEVGAERHRIALVPEQEAGSDLWGGTAYYSVWARLAPFYEAQMWAGPAPLDWNQQLAEKKARMLLADSKSVKLLDKNASWRAQPATEVQLEKLAKWQARFKLVYDPETVTKGEASDMLDMVYGKFEEWRKKKGA
jgi:superfamily II DNA or RNA helicase